MTSAQSATNFGPLADVRLVVVVLICGLVVGGVARFVLPGRHPIGFRLTLVAGVIGAVVGGLVAYALGGGLLIAAVAATVVAAGLVRLFHHHSEGRLPR